MTADQLAWESWTWSVGLSLLKSAQEPIQARHHDVIDCTCVQRPDAAPSCPSPNTEVAAAAAPIVPWFAGMRDHVPAAHPAASEAGPQKRPPRGGVAPVP